jgi:hypothetical protein
MDKKITKVMIAIIIGLTIGIVVGYCTENVHYRLSFDKNHREISLAEYNSHYDSPKSGLGGRKTNSAGYHYKEYTFNYKTGILSGSISTTILVLIFFVLLKKRSDKILFSNMSKKEPK